MPAQYRQLKAVFLLFCIPKTSALTLCSLLSSEEHRDKPLPRFCHYLCTTLFRILAEAQSLLQSGLLHPETCLSCANGRAECNSTSDFSKKNSTPSFARLTGKTAKLIDMKPLSFLALLFSGTFSVLCTCLVYVRSNLRVQFTRILPGGPTGPGGPGDPGGP